MRSTLSNGCSSNFQALVFRTLFHRERSSDLVNQGAFKVSNEVMAELRLQSWPSFRSANGFQYAVSLSSQGLNFNWQKHESAVPTKMPALRFRELKTAYKRRLPTGLAHLE